MRGGAYRCAIGRASTVRCLVHRRPAGTTRAAGISRLNGPNEVSSALGSEVGGVDPSVSAVGGGHMPVSGGVMGVADRYRQAVRQLLQHLPVHAPKPQVLRRHYVMIAR